MSVHFMLGQCKVEVAAVAGSGAAQAVLLFPFCTFIPQNPAVPQLQVEFWPGILAQRCSAVDMGEEIFSAASPGLFPALKLLCNYN